MKSRGFARLLEFLWEYEMGGPMSVLEALDIADACQEGRGPEEPHILATAVLRLMEIQYAPERLIGLIGRLYTVTAALAAKRAPGLCQSDKLGL